MIEEGKDDPIARQAAEQAVVPPPPAFMRLEKDVKAAGQEKASERVERLFIEAAASDFWTAALKPYLRGIIEDMTRFSAVQIGGTGFDLREIGLRYLVRDLVNGKIQQVIDRIERAHKVREHEVAADEQKGDIPE